MTEWRSSGVRWQAGRPELVWHHPGRGERGSGIALGQPLAFTAGPDRRCAGVWRHGRRLACPASAELAPASTAGLCRACSDLDRSSSVAADTRPDDARPFAVYLAWFGPGLLKVGITADERGSARLLEQGALAFTWLGCGPLMAARAAETAVRTGLAVPERLGSSAKRAARAGLPPWPERAGELAEAHRSALALPGWPGSLRRRDAEPVDHSAAFGLAADGAPAPTARVTGLAPHTTVAGTVRAVVGGDVHLSTTRPGGPGLLLLDARLLSGWTLARAAPDAPVTAPLIREQPTPASQDSLF